MKNAVNVKYRCFLTDTNYYSILYFTLSFSGFVHCSVGLYSIHGTIFTRRRLRGLPTTGRDGMAAWRSGGIPALPFKSARPAAVAPNRSLRAGILRRMSVDFHAFGTVCFIRFLQIREKIHFVIIGTVLLSGFVFVYSCRLYFYFFVGL